MVDDILDDRSVGGVSGAKRLAQSYRQLPAVADLMLVHRSTQLRGRLLKFTDQLVVIQDRSGGRHTFENHPGSFAYNGETVTLVRPGRPQAAQDSSTRLSAAGGVVARDQVARVAQASRLWVEGDHDARFIERVWGDELREFGIVVEPMRGIDDLIAAVAAFGPRADRRLAILVDHLVPGSKETRLTEQISDPNVLILGHPFVDIWQCVRPRSMGIDSWPEVPKGEEWKAGICRRLGWGSTTEGWKRVLSAVNSFADLEPELVGAVEQALDMLAPPEEESE
ncbi:unannotated protein [freshwater metagenome]|uniref:Unannotated protein n=1 Tax=freshwater metagenome TaxID=449393 RepID=A0A6J6CW11_9ZZZZ